MKQCPKCGADTNMMVNATMIIPTKYEHKLSKTALRDKHVQLYGVDWEKASYFCNDKCGKIA